MFEQSKDPSPGSSLEINELGISSRRELSPVFGYVSTASDAASYSIAISELTIIETFTNLIDDEFRTLHEGTLKFEELIDRADNSSFEILGTMSGSEKVVIADKDRLAVAELFMSTPKSYSQITVNIYSERSSLDAIVDRIRSEIVFDPVSEGLKYDLKWLLRTANGLNTVNSTEILSETILDEAYPYIDKSIDRFAEDYLTSPASLLLLHGEQGTGKTRFIRNIVKKACELKSSNPCVLYTSDKETMQCEELFIKLSVEDNDFLVLEGADELLADREDTGSDSVVHKFLSVSDGFASSDRKIILSTNMELDSVDKALIRPGRCFAVQEFKPLSVEQANTLIDTLDPECPRSAETSMTIAEVYNIVFEYSEGTDYHPDEIGFKTDNNGIGFSN